MNNYLPPIPENDGTAAQALEAYRQLGAMALLDIDYWQGQSEQPLGTYYEDRLRHMQDQTALIKIDQDRKPIAYAVWDVDPDDETVTHIRRQAAPFGDHFALQKSLAERLPEGTKSVSHHPRSAREVQTAWAK